MKTSELLADCIGRVREQVPGIVDGLDADSLAWRPDPEANSIAWLLWHLTRIEDDHIADVAGTEQAWTDDGWMARFELPLPAEDHGFGHSSDQVAAVRASAELLAGYHEEVARRAASYVEGLTDADLDRVVDERWDPPVTLGVRLVSVVCEINQHAGQAAYLRGLLDRR
ncbi:MAG TPA: DUF664 domain-containing protein [Marmoricola sp.]|jgi:hypothetical protein